jgi:hypothetical protein
MKKLIYLLFLASCSDYQKIDSWRSFVNQRTLLDQSSPLSLEENLDYWVSKLEYYCEKENWSKKNCLQNIQTYREDYRIYLNKKAQLVVESAVRTL